MKAKKGLIITALILFAINWIATTISGYFAVTTMMHQMPILSLQFLWTVFNALVGVIVAILLTAAAICALREKGSMLASAAFFLCAMQNFLSFVPNWQTVLYSITLPRQLFMLVGIDWLVGIAYLAAAICALLKWRGKIAGIIGACVVLAVRGFAICRATYYICLAMPAAQVLPVGLKFVACILCLNVGILLYIVAQKKKVQ